MSQREVEDKAKAIVQLNTLETVFSWEMDLRQALKELSLLDKKYLAMAEAEGLELVSQIIKEELIPTKE